jgi:bifunctional UDP-N-acetylglucosamine pyrophosphorylase / glucosamine-1-phosphate N-acetyltransferase
MFGIVLAAGKGTRMNSHLSKVLHKVNEKPMILIIVEKLLSINLINKILVVVGDNEKDIKNCLKFNLSSREYYNIIFIKQAERLGTGHAIKMCKEYLSSYKEMKSIILFGDVPLISIKTLNNMIEMSLNKDITVGICKTEKPKGCGRIILKDDYIINSIEEKDCTEEQKQIKLINTGIYILKNQFIVDYIDFVKNNNVQKEYYLPDLIIIF